MCGLIENVWLKLFNNLIFYISLDNVYGETYITHSCNTGEGLYVNVIYGGVMTLKNRAVLLFFQNLH